MRVRVCRTRSGEVVSTSFPEETPVSEVLRFPDIVHTFDLSGSPDEYVLFNITQSFEYEDHDTLTGKSTRNGDLLMITVRPSCGL